MAPVRLLRSRAFWQGFFDGLSGQPMQCLLGWHRMIQREDATHFWRECAYCGFRDRLVTHEAIRSYLKAQERIERIEEKSARILASKPALANREDE